MHKVALLDGDGFLHRIAASMEKTIHGVSWTSPHNMLAFGVMPNYKEARAVAEERAGDLWQRREIGTLDEAIARLRAAVNETISVLGTKEVGFIVSGVRNFRDQIGTIRKYKGNRDTTARPALLDELRDWASSEYTDYLVSDNMEADDLISILARGDEHPSELVMVSTDKDLRQIPGYHYNWVTKEREYVSEVLSKQILYKQILTGDAGDNIIGCWGIGPKKAAAEAVKWTEEEYPDSAIWSSIVDLFEKSKSKEGCPYSDIDADEVAEEMYLLVHLLEYGQEAEDILRSKYYVCLTDNKKTTPIGARESRTSGKTEKNQGNGTSESAPSAGEAEQKYSGPPAPSATV